MKKKHEKAWPVESAAAIYLILILAGMILAGYYSPTLGYGLSLPGDYPPAVGAIFVVLSLAGLVPGLRKRLVLLLQPPAAGEPVFSSSRILIFSLLVGLFTFICPPANPMMGDGPIYIYDVETYYSPHEWIFGLKDPFCVIHTGLHHLFVLASGSELYSASSSSLRAYLVFSLVSALGAFVFINAFFRVIAVLVKDKSMLKPLAAVMLTLGTMAIFSGYIEFIALRVALLMVFILVAVRTLKEGASPWPLMILSLFCLGFYVAFLALGPAVLYVIYCRRTEIIKKPLSWLFPVLVPSLVFLVLISGMVGPGEFFSMFVSGGDSLSLEAKGDVLYGLFSLNHLLDLANVILLHSPLNLAAAAWIVYALLFFRSRWSKDRISGLLLFLLLGFGFELFIFNAKRGIFFDWDIFSYPGLLLPLTAFRLWEVCAPAKARPRIAAATAVLLPLAVLHLLLWGTTLHTREILLKKMMRCEYTQTGKKMWASGLSSYCVRENYFPEYIVDLAGKDENVRQFMVYRLSTVLKGEEFGQEDIDFVSRLADRWADKLSPLDHANIGGLFLDKNNPEESLYFLRLSTNAMDGEICLTAAANLAKYYGRQNRPAASLHYYSLLPEDKLQEENPAFFRTLKSWERQGCLQDSLEAITSEATRHVFNNAVALARKKHLKSAEQEFIAVKMLGIKSSKIDLWLEQIRKLKKGEL